MVKIPMDADILPPSDDHIFKTLLTHPDAEGALISVVSAVLERLVTSVQVRNNELPVSDVDEKTERLDVNCIVDGGDQIDVEMQASRRVEATDDEYRSFINKSIYYLTDLEMWSVFFKFAPDPKYRDFVNKIIEIKEGVAMASAVLMEISKDEHERARLRSRRMYETDLYSDMATAELRGELRGEGRERLKNAQAMIAEGMGVDVISRITGLKVDEVLRLK